MVGRRLPTAVLEAGEGAVSEGKERDIDEELLDFTTIWYAAAAKTNRASDEGQGRTAEATAVLRAVFGDMPDYEPAHVERMFEDFKAALRDSGASN
jgi:hypothetical protein